MASRNIAVGIIGAGGNTKLHHIPKLQAMEGVEVRVIANRTQESAERVCQQFGVPKATGNWLDVIRDDSLDAIVVGTWPYMHRTLILQALQHGKHVLTEARLAMDASEAREMLQALRARPDLVAQVVPSPYTLIWDATIQDIIKQGTLGSLNYISVRGVVPSFPPEAAPVPALTWRQDASMSGMNIMSLGIFYEPLQRWVGDASRVMAMGKVVTKVLADAEGRPRGVTIPDHLDVVAEMACGAQAHFLISSVLGAAQAPTKAYTLYGSKGTLHLDIDAQRLQLSDPSSGGTYRDLEVASEKKGEWRVEEEFVGAIRGQEAIQLTSFETGLRYMQFTQAVHESCRTGQAVNIQLQ